MCDSPQSAQFSLRVSENDDVDAVVIAFRKNGTLHELAELPPGVEATLRKY